MSDLIKREDAINAVHKYFVDAFNNEPHEIDEDGDDVFTDMKSVNALLHHNKYVSKALKALPSADAVQGWIPCSERLPDELAAVNITWVNHNPPPYYKYTKDVPLVDSAVYYRGKWYWWDATVIDLLGEYDGAYIHGIEPIDKDIEITAWMPLPKPYREDGEA